MTSSNRLVFFGTEEFSVPSLRALIDSDYDIAAVVTKPDTRKGRGNKLFVHPIKQLGLDNNISIIQPTRLSDIGSELASLNASAAVLVSYGKIIPQSIIDIFEPIGIINIHPSALPKYRGPSPIEATILAGDDTTAISIMRLDSGMDTGPIFAQAEVSLSGTETKQELSKKLSIMGAEFLLKTLPGILSGDIKATPQPDNNDVSVTSLIVKQNGILDPTTDKSDVLERKIRAYLEYPKSHLNIFGHDVIVTSSKIVDSQQQDQLILPCAEKTFLKIETLIAPSGRTMSGSDFMRGYAKR